MSDALSNPNPLLLDLDFSGALCPPQKHACGNSIGFSPAFPSPRNTNPADTSRPPHDKTTRRAEHAQPPLPGLPIPIPPRLTRAEEHARRHKTEQAVLKKIEETTPYLLPLARFVIPRMPGMPLASATLHTDRATSARTYLLSAISMPWIAFNTPEFVNVLTTDCDHTRAEELLDALMPYLTKWGVPRPMVVTGDNGKSHVSIWLSDPVYVGPQTQKSYHCSGPALRLLSFVRQLLVLALEGDPAHTNMLTKNPFGMGPEGGTGRMPGRFAPPLGVHPVLWDPTWEPARPMWTVVPGDMRTVGLKFLCEALKAWALATGVPLPRLQRSGSFRHARRPKFVASEKGKQLFDASRFRVYDLGTSDLGIIQSIVDEEAARLGSPAGPRARNCIARSIARFMKTKWWGRRSADRRRRGIMNLDRNIPRRERMAIGGRFGAKTKSENVTRRIFAAVDALRAAGKSVTQASVAAASGCSVSSVARLWSRIGGDAVEMNVRPVVLGAQRAAAARAAKTDAAIDAAVTKLLVEGADVTKKAVAALAGCSVDSVERRWKRIAENVAIHKTDSCARGQTSADAHVAQVLSGTAGLLTPLADPPPPVPEETLADLVVFLPGRTQHLSPDETSELSARVVKVLKRDTDRALRTGDVLDPLPTAFLRLRGIEDAAKAYQAARSALAKPVLSGKVRPEPFTHDCSVWKKRLATLQRQHVKAVCGGDLMEARKLRTIIKDELEARAAYA